MAEKYLYDFLDAYISGINSDLPPLKLPKDVAAWTTNCTLRGGYPRPRPPRFRKTLTFASTAAETAFLGGYFQGAGWYRPDFGQSQLIAAVSGRLYSLTEVGSGFTVADITVPGDPNLSTTNQVWMNQAEKWLIVTDGSAQLPIFYDGVSSRRSYGPSVVLATVTSGDPANFPNPRVIGETITVNLAAPFDGPYDVPVIFNGEFYQTVAGGGGGVAYSAILTNQTATPGDSIPSGSDIVSIPSIIGTVVFASPFYIIPNSGLIKFIDITVSNPVPAASLTGNLIINSTSLSRTTLDTSTTQITLRLAAGSPVPTISIGDTITAASTSGLPTSVVAVTAAVAINPPVNGTVTIPIAAPYTGASGATVWIGDKRYLITGSGSPGPSTRLNLINLSDTTDAGAAVPAEDILSVPELPAGRMGAYGLGHQTMSLVDGLSFLYGDTVGGPSGTQANNYRDAVLKTTENAFLEANGSFRVPSAGEVITSMTFTAILDAAYGQGPLQIGTASRIFTCAVPDDRATWVALENPILTVALIGDGPLSQNSTKLANSDTLFRNSEGLGSLIYGRRNFETWGNTPISTEVNRTIESDDSSLLGWSSSEPFDNRYLETASPASTSSGIVHAETVALNFDPVSSLRGKAPSIWESVWDGLNILQKITGQFGSVKRCFYFAVNSSNQIELWEQLRSKSTEYYDNGTDRITFTVESPCIFKPEERSDKIPIVRLTNGKIHIDQVRGAVEIAVEYRPDFHRAWTPWITLNISDATAPGYLTPLGLGEPPTEPCDVPNNRPLRSGRFFQVKVTCTGQAVIMGMEFSAVEEPSIVFPSPSCDTIES